MSLYRMKIIFKADVSLKSINDMTELIDGSHAIMQNAIEMSMEQTVPFVPKQDTLTEYARIIKENSETDQLHIEDVRFSHYDFFEEVPQKISERSYVEILSELQSQIDSDTLPEEIYSEATHLVETLKKTLWPYSA